jgi:hypothetical protein
MEQTNSSTTSGTDRSVVDRVRNAASAQLATQKDRATDTLGSLASAVRQSTQTLRDQRQDNIAQYMDRAADQIDRLSASLRDRDVNRLMNDAQQFARRQPALFIGAAFAAGVLAARFLKSSSRRNGEGDWRRFAATPQYDAAMGTGSGARSISAAGPRYAGGL